MIAIHTGYTPGVFSHMVANEQIYDRHIEAAEEMLNRYNSMEDDGKRPYLYVDTIRTTNFYDFTIEDFTMADYQPIKPQLKLELGI